jgi:hypothetical protein
VDNADYLDLAGCADLLGLQLPQLRRLVRGAQPVLPGRRCADLGNENRFSCNRLAIG